METEFVTEQQAEVALTPSQALARVKAVVKGIGGFVLEGEVSNRSTSSSGHLYFKVKDADSAVACVAWKGVRGRLVTDPQDGQRVRVMVKEGSYYGEKLNFVVSQVEPVGEGALLERARLLLEKLTHEGLCDAAHKKPLPRFPRSIGLIAGNEARAITDVVEALHERFPVPVVLHRALVQGVGAPDAIIGALARLQSEPRVDVIVIARGGGSVEDRDAFNHEGLCRAIAASPVAVVTAIGHSQDSHVCDAVADLCGATGGRRARGAQFGRPVRRARPRHGTV